MSQPSTRIKTEYLMTLHAPLEAPQRASHDLLIYDVLPGGWVRGPRINGELIAPSADWLRVLPDGTSKLDVRASIRADDSSIIYYELRGRIVTSDASNERQQANEALGVDDMFFMTALTFETASEKFAWLNGVVAVGKMISSLEPTGERLGHVRYDIFSVT